MNREEIRTKAQKLTESSADKGKIIEVGWMGFLLHVIPDEAPQIQIDEMRKAFFAGAHHLFSSIMSMLDPGAEPTERDMDRMSKINDELSEYRKKLVAEHPLR